MRYLLTLLLTFTFACGEESSPPYTKKNQDSDLGVGMVMDGGVGEMVCDNTLDCMSDEGIQDKLLNLLHRREFEPEPFEFESEPFEFEPEPFEFDFEDEDEEQKG